VGNGGGQKADTDAMATASKNITQLAEDLTDETKKLGTTEITAKEFGTIHGAHSKDYTAGVGMLDASVKGYGTTLTGFAGNIAAGGSAYSANEDAQSSAVNNAGKK
jgi:hypothetical protein